MKITQSIQRDIEFYKSIVIEIDPSIKTIEAIQNAKPGNLTPEEAFAQYDTNGCLDGVSDKDATLTLFKKKAGANLQIKMWAEGVADEPPTMPLIEVIEMMIEKSYPIWVLFAITRQATDMFYNRRGFIPSFTNSIPAEIVYDRLSSLSTDKKDETL